MATKLLADRPSRKVRMVDPCAGPGTFASALNAGALLGEGDVLVGLDIDAGMVGTAKRNASNFNFRAEYRADDYLLTPLEQSDYVIMNPPYVRQEWISLKAEYQEAVRRLWNSVPQATSNLYVYFAAKAIAELTEGGRFAFIMYDSWQYTLFGSWLKDLIFSNAIEIEIEPAGPQPFSGRLIDATIVFGRKRTPEGKTLVTKQRRKQIGKDDQTTTIGQAFQTHRGLRLKQASFFRCSLSDCDKFGATPFLKKVGNIKGYAVPDDHDDAAILIFGPGDNTKAESALEDRIAVAKLSPLNNKSILNWHHERPDTWMFHRPPKWSPIVFNYYLRNRPRHLLNPSRIFSDNFYGLYPHTGDAYAWLAILNSTVVAREILNHSRNQGGGLRKIQLYEYRDVRIPDLTSLGSNNVSVLGELGRRLASAGDATIIGEIDEQVARFFDEFRGVSDTPGNGS